MSAKSKTNKINLYSRINYISALGFNFILGIVFNLNGFFELTKNILNSSNYNKIYYVKKEK